MSQSKALPKFLENDYNLVVMESVVHLRSLAEKTKEALDKEIQGRQVTIKEIGKKRYLRLINEVFDKFAASINEEKPDRTPREEHLFVMHEEYTKIHAARSNAMVRMAYSYPAHDQWEDPYQIVAALQEIGEYTNLNYRQII